MIDQDKSKQELIEELAELRQRVTVRETADTDRKQAEQALRESEERFRKVFTEGPLGIMLVGTDGRIQHANQHFCDMLGYSEDEMIAVGLAGIAHPDDWERDRPFFYACGMAKSRITTRRNAIVAKMANCCGGN